MYLRFRHFHRNRQQENLAYCELYEMIHSRPSPELVLLADSRIQVSLVENRRVGGKPRQKHLAVIANLPQDSRETIRKKLNALGIEKELTLRLLAQILPTDGRSGDGLSNSSSEFWRNGVTNDS